MRRSPILNSPVQIGDDLAVPVVFVKGVETAQAKQSNPVGRPHVESRHALHVAVLGDDDAGASSRG